MKTIISGSREIEDYAIVKIAIESSGFDISEIASGHARGVDSLAEQYAKLNKIPVKLFPAEWDDLDVEPCSVKTNKFGKKYNALAGFNRNEQMANYADALIAVFNGSPGTRNMIELATKRGLKVFVYDVQIV